MINPLCTCRQQVWNRSHIWDIYPIYQALRTSNQEIVSRLRRLYTIIIKVLVFLSALLSLDSNINTWKPEILRVIADRILVISDCLVSEFRRVARILMMSGLSSIKSTYATVQTVTGSYSILTIHCWKAAYPVKHSTLVLHCKLSVLPMTGFPTRGLRHGNHASQTDFTGY